MFGVDVADELCHVRDAFGCSTRRRSRTCASPASTRAWLDDADAAGDAARRSTRPTTGATGCRMSDAGRPIDPDVEPTDASASAGRSARPAHDAGMSMRALAARVRRQPAVPQRRRAGPVDAVDRHALPHRRGARASPPSTLLPAPARGDIQVVRAGDGPLVPSSDRPGSAIGRVVFSDDDQGLEVYEYVADADRRPRRLVRARRRQGAAPHRGHARASSSRPRPSEHLGARRLPRAPGHDRPPLERSRATAPVRLFLVVLRDPA